MPKSIKWLKSNFIIHMFSPHTVDAIFKSQASMMPWKSSKKHMIFKLAAKLKTLKLITFKLLNSLQIVISN